MDHKEEQSMELEALQAIYLGELELIDSEYPNIKFRFDISSAQGDEQTELDFSLGLIVELPEKYPEEIPHISIEPEDEDDFEEERLLAVVEKLKETAEENIGMQMVFTIVSSLQDEMGVLLDERKKASEQVQEEVKAKVEAENRKKFEGTVTTPESFRAWKDRFDAERKAAIEKAEQDRLAALAGRLTGKQLFLRDASLNLSDVALIGETVEIDESLFDQEELEGLELDSDSDDEE